MNYSKFDLYEIEKGDSNSEEGIFLLIIAVFIIGFVCLSMNNDNHNDSAEVGKCEVPLEQVHQQHRIDQSI